MSTRTRTLRELSTRVVQQGRYVPATLALVWEAAKRWTLLWAILTVVQGLLPVALVYLTREVVDALVAALEAPESAAMPAAIMYMVLMATALLVREILRSVLSYVRIAQSEHVQDHICELIHRKSAEVDLEFYETPEFYDHLHRARYEAQQRPIELVENLGRILGDGITLISMMIVLVPYGAWLPLLLLLSTIPALLVVIRYAVRRHGWRRSVTSRERKGNYFDWLLTSARAASELRLFGLGGWFTTQYQDIRDEVREERLDLERKEATAEAAAGFTGLVVAGLALVYMAWRAMRGLVTLGDLALFYQAFNEGQRMMRSLLENAGKIYGNVLFLGDLFAFLNLESGIRSGRKGRQVAALNEGIRFQGVSFQYPGSDRWALRSLDLSIPAGRIVAVVGPNGSGKSTIVKLLCRFYDPTDGEISIDGTDIRELQVDDLRRLVSAVFQEPVHYNDTVKNNIEIGRRTGPGSEDAESRERAAQRARANEVIERLPNGYDTLLGKWFVDGTELSTGEWQRIALARAYVRGSPILCLDEPTSFMDSWSESEWLRKLRSLSTEATVLLITHRFTTAMHADLIYVIEEGKVVESGAHRELLDHGGRYALGWKVQIS